MNYITTTLKLGRKVSLVLWLMDQYRSLGCNEEISVYLNDYPAAFQRKAGGYLIFTDLEEDCCRLSIESQYYFKEQLEINLKSLNRSEPIVYVPLKPAPSYPFNPGATLIRASLSDKKGHALKAAVTATLGSDKCARAKLGRQGAQAGDKEISLLDVTGRIAAGDLLLIRPREEKSGEICEVVTTGAGDGIYSLKQPLLSDHQRGELLMPVILTRSDNRGEAVIAIRDLRQKECRVEVKISAEERSKVMEVEIASGVSHQLGKIVI